MVKLDQMDNEVKKALEKLKRLDLTDLKMLQLLLIPHKDRAKNLVAETVIRVMLENSPPAGLRAILLHEILTLVDQEREKAVQQYEAIRNDSGG